MAPPTMGFTPPIEVSEFVRRYNLDPTLADKVFQRIHWVQVKNLQESIIAIGVNTQDRERYYQVPKETLEKFLDAKNGRYADERYKLGAIKDFLIEILKQPKQTQLHYVYKGKSREEAVEFVRNTLASQKMSLDKLLEWDVSYLAPGAKVCVGVHYGPPGQK